ncbi:transcriptional regulator [Brevibacillus laterosporus]|nr:zinc ribbon domain-containing protein [Brevibacillus laterosporus]TPG69206.1 transcriptional regulator [Brevibacillus laterosporus]
MTTTFCQSCSMPLHEEVLGTEQDNSKSQEYCTYCYDKGAFTAPDCTMEQMIEICIPHMVGDGMSEQQARTMLTGLFPQLKRWAHENSTANSHPSLEEPRLVHLEELTISGISARTTNARELSGAGVISDLWDQYFSENIGEKLSSNRLSPDIYGVYADYENGVAGEYTILLGNRMAAKSAVDTANTTTLTLPAAQYAVFTSRCGPLSEVVIEAWQFIWAWSMNSGMRRTFTGDFERYDERASNPNEAIVEIYIAVEAPVQ